MTSLSPASSPRILIRYCPRCGWLLRSAWIMQELLTTFTEELSEVALAPAEAGTFQILLDQELIWCRRRDGGFPDIKWLKQQIRDRINPERSLGHSDRR